MTEHVASIIILCVAALGAGVWLASVLAALRMRSGTEQDEPLARVEVKGQAEDVARRIARSAASSTPLGLTPLRVEVKDGTRVRFWSPAGASVMPLTSGFEGQFDVRRTGDASTRVTLRTNRAAQKRGAKVALLLCLLLGLPLLVLLPAALLIWVAPHPDPAARYQAVQVIHVGHALWPPFLILWMGRRNQHILDTSLAQVLDRIRLED